MNILDEIEKTDGDIAYGNWVVEESGKKCHCFVSRILFRNGKIPSGWRRLSEEKFNNKMDIFMHDRSNLGWLADLSLLAGKFDEMAHDLTGQSYGILSNETAKSIMREILRS